MSLEYRIGDVRGRLAEIPDGSIDLIVTSPPFLALRSYLPADHPDKHSEIGSEATPADFLDTLLGLSAEWARVLAPHGSLCVELGDTYSGSGGAGGDYTDTGLRAGQEKFNGSAMQHRRSAVRNRDCGKDGGGAWPLAKSLTGIPTLYPWSLAYGRNLLTGQPSPAGQWRIRNLIVWARPNPPVGALGDKFRPATSYITVACKSAKRYFDLDAVRGDVSEWTRGYADHIPLSQRSLTSASQGDRTRLSTNGEGLNQQGAPPLDWHTDDHPEDGDWLWKLSTQPYKGSHYACVDDQTEALTLNGWKAHEDLIDGEHIAAYDAERGVLTWQPATFHRYPFTGQLVAINQRETVQRLTPNHRVLMRTRKGSEHTIEASELLTSHSVPLIAPFDYQGSQINAAWASLFGWFVTEGHIPPPGAQPRAMLYQSESANPQHVNTIRSLLLEVGAEFREHKAEREWRGRPSVSITFTIYGEAASQLRAFGKSIPASVLSWADRPLRLFMDALIDGDGHRRSSGRAAFICKHEADADMFQAIAARLGMRSTVSQRSDGQYSTTIGQRSWASLRGTNGASRGVITEHYEGIVWCPSVPATYWLARRNGRPFITGNTFPLALPKRLIEAMCPLRVCAVCGRPSERIVGEAEYVKPDGTPHRFNGDGFETEATGANRRKVTGADNGNMARVAPTLGWSDCGHDNWRTGVVLDPFAGSGTTLEAAQAVGRHAIGIDLDARNADLARARVGMFLTVDGAAA